jgi:Cu+-exporting ATPase
MMKKTTQKVEGLHCYSCVLEIENALKSLKGVVLAKVDYTNEELQLQYEESQISIEEISTQLNQIGYRLTSAEEVHHFIHKEKKRVWIVFGLTLPIFLEMFSGYFEIRIPFFDLIAFVLTTLILVFTKGIILGGASSLFRLKPNMDSLIFLGTATAYVYSVFILCFHYFGKIEAEFIYFETAALILFFITLGKYFEMVTKQKAGDAAKELMKLQPKMATRIEEGKDKQIPIEQIQVKDLLRIHPGETIPIDGSVVEGSSFVDEKLLTGESLPITKERGSKVFAGTLNKEGGLVVQAEKVGKEMLLSQIIEIISNAMKFRAPIQDFADRVAFYFVWIVLVIGLFTFSTWMLLGFPLYFSIKILVAIYIIACPCALGLATPTVVMVANGMASKLGILIKTGKSLELAKKLTTIVFDKTGTLTKGELKLVEVKLFNEAPTKEKLLEIAKMVEGQSEHPIKQALKEVKETAIKVEQFQAKPGFGVQAIVEGKKVLIGNAKFLQENSVDPQGNEEHTLMSIGGQLMCAFVLEDEVRPESKQVVKDLEKLNIEVIMLTGDKEGIAKKIAQELNIKKVISNVLPQDKSKVIEGLKKEQKIIGMVGDGINDAPALALSDIGIAVGSASDVALAAGDIILMKNDLRDVIIAIELSKATNTKIKQNLFWAFFYNVAAIPIAAGIFYPLLLSPVVAAIAMAFSSVCVVLNALLFKTKKFHKSIGPIGT